MGISKIFKYSFFDLLRSRWSIIYFVAYLVISFTLLYLGNDLAKGIISLMNIVIILTPLISLMLGVIYFYNSREFIELLLAQPIKRSSIFLGQFFGMTSALSLSLLLGMGLPFLFYGIIVSAEVFNFLVLILIGLVLTLVFTALAFWIALKHENRLKGFGLAILIWLFMAVLYDGIFLLLLLFFQDYPVEQLSLALTVLNPIDLARIIMMLKLDISALLGFTGAVYKKFFGTSMGIFISLTIALLWMLIPVHFISRISQKKDF